MILDSAIKAKKKYYPQTILEECKYEPENIKMEDLIDDDLKKKVHLMSIVVNQMIRKIMINLTNNLLKVKKKYFNNGKSLIECVN